MSRLSLRSIWLLAAASCFISGCARDYHAYPDGCVAYGYRPQPALPFSFYRGCPTPWFERHAAWLQNETRDAELSGSSLAR